MTDKRFQLCFPPAEMLESSIYVDREQVDVTCHRCEIEDITEYLILQYYGRFEITRWQDCLELIE